MGLGNEKVKQKYQIKVWFYHGEDRQYARAEDDSWYPVTYKVIASNEEDVFLAALVARAGGSGIGEAEVDECLAEWEEEGFELPTTREEFAEVADFENGHYASEYGYISLVKNLDTGEVIYQTEEDKMWRGRWH